MIEKTALLALALAIVSVSAVPAAAEDQTVRGRVQSVQDERIVVKTDDGRVVTINAKEINATARGLVHTGEPIVVTGPLTGNEMQAKSLTVAASTAGARALAGQPPFGPDEGGAASPSERDQNRK